MAFIGNGAQLTDLDAGDIASGTLPVARGGTGTASPSLVGGTNITISGSWPNQTVTAGGGGVTSLNGQTGAITNTNLNVIGSYAIGAGIAGTGTTGQNTTYNAGSTYSGSIIVQINSNVSGAYGPCFQNVDNLSGRFFNVGLSGTWRAMGSSKSSSYGKSGFYTSGTNIWVRVS
jgi:hypothetical protein